MPIRPIVSGSSFCFLLLLTLLQLLRPTLCQLEPFPLDDAAVRRVLGTAMRCQNLPQLHAAVVHSGRELRTYKLQLQPDGSVVDIPQPVLMPIASVSKGMFSTVLPMVQKQLREDRRDPSFNLFTTPIKQLLGDKADFWFLDHQRTEAVTIDDVTSHTTGLARHDALSILLGLKSKSELVQRMGRFNAVGQFRGSYIYNNLVWSIADHVVERLTGKNFTAYMRQFLWQPLGMSGAIGSSEMDSLNRVQLLFRSPKYFRSGRVPLERTSLERSVDLVEAAGGIYLHLEDMVKYMHYHTRNNYSSFLPPPEPFKAVNAFVAGQSGLNPSFMNESVSDLPDINAESYGHGWERGWYRDNLMYEHGGSFFGAHCHLRVLLKRRIAVFSHASMGPSDSLIQTAYPRMLNHYLTDLLLRNASFVTESNVCSLFRRVNPGEPATVPRRELAQAETQTCTGSFGNYGFGTLSVSLNASSGLLNAAYGDALFEMVPVRLSGQPDGEFSFFLSILRPSGFPVEAPIIGANASHVTLRPGVLPHAQQPPRTALFMRIWQQSGGQVLMNLPMFDESAQLVKGLRPEGWQRPESCPSKGAAAVGGTGGGGLWVAATAAALAISVVSGRGCDL